MACSISPTSSTRKPHQKWHQKSLTSKTFHLSRYSRPLPLQSVARDAPADLSRIGTATDGIKPVAAAKPAITKDPVDLWHRYVDWLYQHKEIGLYLDVSRIGFIDEFLERMEPRMQRAFEAMTELEKRAIANPDEGRMVGHYWLRNPKMAPTSFLTTQIERTVDSICEFADKIVR